MSVFMNWLRREFGAISEEDIRTPPEYQVGPNDQVFGAIKSLETRKIFELRRRVSEDHNESVKAFKEKWENFLDSEGDDHDSATCERCTAARETFFVPMMNIIFLDQLIMMCILSEMDDSFIVEYEKKDSDRVVLSEDWSAS